MATSSKAKKKTVRLASGLKRARQDAGDKAKAVELFKTAEPVIDSIADKGLFHKNKAARHKSRLAAKVKALATA
jgi:small subunit ribosomal protein S20